MKYGVIGAGAVGGYYGSRLAESGQDVCFLLHKDYEYVKANGLQVESCRGSFRIEKPEVYGRAEDMPPCDVVLVGLKTTNNHLLTALLPPLLKPDTLVVLIQNGIGVEDDVQKMMPGVQLAAGLAFICSQKTEPGLIRHQCYGMINLGNYSCRDQQKFAQVLADFRAAHIKAEEVPYLEARWKKAVWNMPFNGMTVALNTQTDRLLANEKTRALVWRQMMEVVGAAQHLGVKNLDAGFAEQMIALTLDMVPYSPSMKLDYDFRRPMEIDYLYTRPIAIAKASGFEMPALEMLEAELRFIENEHKS